MLQSCNAGQEPPLVIGATGMRWLETGGPVLGLLDGVGYEFETRAPRARRRRGRLQRRCDRGAGRGGRGVRPRSPAGGAGLGCHGWKAEAVLERLLVGGRALLGRRAAGRRHHGAGAPVSRERRVTDTRPAATLDGFAEATEAVEGVDLRDLEPLTRLFVRTCNSEYRFVVSVRRRRAGGGRALLRAADSSRAGGRQPGRQFPEDRLDRRRVCGWRFATSRAASSRRRFVRLRPTKAPAGVTKATPARDMRSLTGCRSPCVSTGLPSRLGATVDVAPRGF